MLFFLRKIFLSDEEIILSNVITHPEAPKLGQKTTLKYKPRHFQTSEKPKKKTVKLINVIYKLMYL